MMKGDLPIRVPLAIYIADCHFHPFFTAAKLTILIFLS